MASFTVTGDIDPFLHVSLKHGEAIYAESNAMVMMESTLQLKGQMTGGFFRSLARRLTSGESFFQQKIEAVNGNGDCLLSPTLPGGMQVLEVGNTQYTLTDGAFVAAETSVELKIKTQGLGTALFGGTGGFFVMETAGNGKVVVSGFGSLFMLDVEPGRDVIIDNYHVVAWESQLQHQITVATGQGGFFGNLVSSVTSGEGMVLRFSGRGKVLIASRNRDNFVQWIRGEIGRVPGSQSITDRI